MSYIDTSVLVAYYCPEALSAKAEKIVRAADTPVISRLVEIEFCSALAIKTRTGELAKDAAQKVLSCLLGHIANGDYRSVPIEAREYLAAREWISAFSTPLRTVDALHLAAASCNDLVIVTADRALATAADALNIRHRLIS